MTQHNEIAVAAVQGRGKGGAVVQRKKRAIRQMVDTPEEQPSTHRKAFEKCWLTLLRAPLPRVLYKRILMHLHTGVIPYLPHPLHLSDFLVASYDKGGIISILALNALFVLIHEHNLEYPQFYVKLYALFEPSVLRSKYRARFFRLADLFLKSSLLPAYLVAAFIKRIARLALSAPTVSALVAVPLIFNMLRRHVSLSFLLHRGPRFASDLIAGDGSTGVDLVTQAIGEDPYNVDEPEPQRSGAMESSLWELEALRRHCVPEVSKLISVFDTPVMRQRPEMDVKTPLELTMDSLFQSEMTRPAKKGKNAGDVALTFQKPTGLFSDTTHFSCWQL